MVTGWILFPTTMFFQWFQITSKTVCGDILLNIILKALKTVLPHWEILHQQSTGPMPRPPLPLVPHLAGRNRAHGDGEWQLTKLALNWLISSSDVCTLDRVGFPICDSSSWALPVYASVSHFNASPSVKKCDNSCLNTFFISQIVQIRHFRRCERKGGNTFEQKGAPFYLFPLHYKLRGFLWVINLGAQSDASDEDSCWVKWPICIQMT